jgi:hypothetical protein
VIEEGGEGVGYRSVVGRSGRFAVHFLLVVRDLPSGVLAEKYVRSIISRDGSEIMH